MGLFSGIAKTVSGVASKALGGVSQVRSVMNMNPTLSGLVFPPQISAGLKAANIIGGAVGIKIPTQSDILGFAQGKLDTVLGGIRSKVKTPLDELENIIRSGSSLDSATKIFTRTVDLQGLNAEEILQSISWLL